VTMTVPLLNKGFTVGQMGFAAFLYTTVVRAESHGASLIRNFFLSLHHVDNRIFGLGIELSRIGVQANNVTGELHHSTLHAQANAEERDLVLPDVAYTLYLSFHASFAEARGDQYAVKPLEQGLTRIMIYVLRRYPLDIDFCIIFCTGVNERFDD